MKKVRKIIAAAISLAMLCPILPNTASAEYTPSANLEIVEMGQETSISATGVKKYETGLGWDVWYVLNSSGLTAWDTINEGFHITNDDSHSGNAALVMNYVNATQGNRFIQLYSDVFSALTTGQQYRVSFWYKGGTIGTNNPGVTLYGTTNQEWNPVTTAWTKIAGANGWNKYYIDVDGNASTKIRFQFACKNSVMLDDIAIQPIKSGSGSEAVLGDNVLTNGGFENFYLGRRTDSSNASLYSTAFIDDNMLLTQWELSAGTETDFIKAVSGAGRTGDNALYVYKQTRGSGSVNNVYQNMTLEPGSYTLKFWVRGWRDSTNVLVTTYPNGRTTAFSDTTLNSGKWADWQEVTKEFTVTETNLKTLPWFELQNRSYLLIDDVTLYKDGDTSTNYIKNGSFEEVTVIRDLINPVLYPVKAGSAATLSWKNPAVDISDVSVTVDGEAYACTPVLTKNSYNEIMITGLTNNQEYEVVLAANINGEAYSKTMTVTPWVRAGDVVIGDWSVTGAEITLDDTVYYGNYNAYIDEEEKADDPSLRFDANISKKVAGLNVGVTQTVSGLTRDKMYRLKFDAKIEGMYNFLIARTILGLSDDYFANFTGLTDSDGNAVSVYDEGTSTTKDWETYALDIVPADDELYDVMGEDTSAYSMRIKLCFEKIIGSLWLDNIELYEVSEEGEVLSGNLLENSTFDYANGYSIDTEFTMLDGDEEIEVSYIPTAGTVTAKALIKNFKETGGLDVVVFAALYNGSELEDVFVLDKTVAEKPLLVPADELTATITVPDLATGDYEIKLMVWDGADTVYPLLDTCGEIAEQAN